jgi:HAD superfamily hydrolase (TIGR01509 family)
VRGLFFDLDDTLYPRDAFVRSGFAAVAHEVAASWRRDREALFATLVQAHDDGRTGSEFQVLCEEHRLPLSLVPRMVDIFRTHTPAIALAPPVRQMLGSLRRDGWRLGILTNGLPAVQRRKVAALGLAPLVDSITYAEEHAPHGKPDAAAFQAAVAGLGVAVSACIFIGDDPVCDIAGARAVGLRAIQIAPSTRGAVAPRTGGGVIPAAADAVVGSVLEAARSASSLVKEMSGGV